MQHRIKRHSLACSNQSNHRYNALCASVFGVPLKAADLESTARYRLSRNYTIANLQTSLAVYDLWLKSQCAVNTEDKLALWEIGRELNINPPAVRASNSRVPLDRATARNRLSALVSRYLRTAKQNIAAVTAGQFPAAAGDNSVD